MQRRASSPFIIALTALLAAVALPARAADYPARPIKLVVPYAAGGPTDVLGRVVGEYLGRDLKQVVVVENKAGAQGAIGAEVVARITSRCFDYLERPVERVTGLDVPYPPPGLEHLYLPNEEKILGAIATLYAENDEEKQA